MIATTSPLDQAISYATRSALDVTPALLPRPTPCRGWNLDMLLAHASESLAALYEGTATGHVGLLPAAPARDPAADPARTFSERAGRLLAARAARTALTERAAGGARAARPAQAAQASTGCRREVVDIGGLPLPALAVEYTGAIEIAVHGWDISQACGRRRPIPDQLAATLLAIAPLLITETGRRPLFSPPVRPAALAGPGDRLVAFLGRQPLDPPPTTFAKWRQHWGSCNPPPVIGLPASALQAGSRENPAHRNWPGEPSVSLPHITAITPLGSITAHPALRSRRTRPSGRTSTPVNLLFPSKANPI